jgi:carbamoyltransferase
MYNESKVYLGLNAGVLGLNFHDPSAAIFIGKQLVAAEEEERHNGIKSSPGIFPVNAIRQCLEKAQVSIQSVDEICVGYDIGLLSQKIELVQRNSESSNPPSMSEIILAAKFRELIFQELGYQGNVEYVDHHLSHAVTAKHYSGASESVVLVFDGVGEIGAGSLYHAKDNQLIMIRRINFPCSAGYFFAAITAFLGFEPWKDEGTVMALAPYGEDDPYVNENLWQACRTTDGKIDFSSFITGMTDNGFALNTDKAVHKLELLLGRAQCQKKDAMKPFNRNLAFSAQHILENYILDQAKWALSKTGCVNLDVAGGVFLNCKLNQKLREMEGVSRFYAFPVSGDSGTAIGACLVRMGKDKPDNSLSNLYLGSTIQDLEPTSHFLNDCPNLSSQRVAELLAENKIVIVAKGNMEFGPRALGNRSILAHPGYALNVERINRLVKDRAPWRPFACTVLSEWAHNVLDRYNEDNVSASFMIETYSVQPEWLSKIPAVVHQADGTTRVQVLSRNANAFFYDVLNAFRILTGIPLLLNTSLNGRHQPILNRSRDIIKFYQQGCADALILNDTLIEGCIISL